MELNELNKDFKSTEIGMIPNDWNLKKLGEIFSFYSTANYSKAEMSLTGEIGCIHYGLIHAISDSNYSLTKGIKYYLKTAKTKYELVKDGDVIMVDASEDLVGINKSVEIFEVKDKKFIAGLHTYLMRDVNLLFANHFRGQILNSIAVKNQMLKLAVGMKVFGVSKSQLKEVLIPLPPIAEQTAIAAALSDMDALIALTEQLIQKKKDIKQGLMQQLLKPKEGWEIKRLEDVCEIIMGQSPLSISYNNNRNGLPLIQGNADIKNRKTIIRSYTSQITKRSKVGDIIMTVRAPVGEIAKTEFECCLGRGVCAIRYENDFIYHYLVSIEGNWKRLSSGSTFDSVNSSQIKELPITIISNKEEQTRIAQILTDADHEITALEKQLKKLRHQKEGMMQVLLTGRIRFKID